MDNLIKYIKAIIAVGETMHTLNILSLYPDMKVIGIGI